MRALIMAALLAAVAATTAGAVQTELDLATVSEAVALGRKSGVERSQLHDAYHVVIATAPVDFVEVVTPFRRLVLEAHARVDEGDRRFGQRQALELLRAFSNRIEVHAELTFHPLNTYVGIPEFDLVLVPANLQIRNGVGRPFSRTAAIAPVELERVPRSTPRTSGFPFAGTAPRGGTGAPQAQPLHGGTLIARFDLRTLDPAGAYDVVIGDAGQVIGRATLTLATMR